MKCIAQGYNNCLDNLENVSHLYGVFLVDIKMITVWQLVAENRETLLRWYLFSLALFSLAFHFLTFKIIFLF